MSDCSSIMQTYLLFPRGEFAGGWTWSMASSTLNEHQRPCPRSHYYFVGVGRIHCLKRDHLRGSVDPIEHSQKSHVHHVRQSGKIKGLAKKPGH